MMEKVGVKSLDDLYAEVPDEIRFRGDYQLPEQMSEVEVRQLFEKLGGQNEQLTCFGGAGVYDHYTPAVIPALLSRSEFLSAIPLIRRRYHKVPSIISLNTSR